MPIRPMPGPRAVLALALVLAAAALPVRAAPPPAEWEGSLEPIAASEWTYARAAHLLERAGFGGTPAEIGALARMSPEDAVARLVDYEAIDAGGLAPFHPSGIYEDPSEIAIFYESFGGYMGHGYKAGRWGWARVLPEGTTRRYQEIIDRIYYGYYAEQEETDRLMRWWLDRMVATPRPLEERMTLFWHAHFGISNRKVSRYALMMRHLETLRAGATGPFGDLLKAVTRDPAMLVFLDGRKNTKTDTNENYAREIMELYALGVGNYSEADIKEAARALTGFAVSGLDVAFVKANFDGGKKTILGRTGRFDADDVVDILLEQDAAARFLARKLYRYFALEDGDPAVEEKLAAVLREADYELKPFLRTLFLSRDFYSARTVGTKIKSPVDLVVSTLRKLELEEVPGVPRVSVTLANLGEVPLDPPSVKGWDRGRNWITPSTLFERANFARHLLFGEEAKGLYHPYRVLIERHEKSVENAALVDRRLALAGGAGKVSESDMRDMMGMSSVSVAAATQDYDLRIGVKNGWLKAWERVPPVHPTIAPVTLARMLFEAKAASAEEALDHFAARFLSVSLTPERRAPLLAFAREKLGTGAIDYLDETLETACRELVHALMSIPEYQLS